MQNIECCTGQVALNLLTFNFKILHVNLAIFWQKLIMQKEGKKEHFAE